MPRLPFPGSNLLAGPPEEEKPTPPTKNGGKAPGRPSGSSDAPETPAGTAEAPKKAEPGLKLPSTAPADRTVEVELVSGRKSIPLKDGRLTLTKGGGAQPFSQLMIQPGGTGQPGEAGAPPAEQALPFEDLLFLRFPWRSKALPPFLLFLRPDEPSAGAPAPSASELAGQIVGGDEDAVRFECSWAKRVWTLPLERVQGLLVTGSQPGGAVPRAEARGSRPAAAARDPFARLLLQDGVRARLRAQILGARLEEDELVLPEEGSTMEGARVAGILEELGAKGLRFHSERLGEVALNYEKVRGLILAPAKARAGKGGKEKPEPRETGGDKAAPPRAAANQTVGEAEAPASGAAPPGREPWVRLLLGDGSYFPGILRELEDGAVTLEVAGVGLVEVPIEEVLEVAFLSGRAVYLSDLEPVAVREEHGLLFAQAGAAKWQYRQDLSVTGGPLRMGGRLYRKGLGVHSYSLLEFDLGAGYSRFQALIGLDESAHPSELDALSSDVASVVFRVRLDQQLLLEKPLTWRDAPVPVELPVAGGKRLALEVDYGGSQESLFNSFNLARDRADWAEARLVR